MAKTGEPGYLTRVIDEEPLQGFRGFLKDDYTPDAAPDYFENRSRLAEILSEDEEMLAEEANRFLKEYHTKDARYLGKGGVEHGGTVYSLYDLLFEPHKIMGTKDRWVFATRTDDRGKGLKELNDTRKWLIKKKRYINNLSHAKHAANPFTALLDASISLQAGAAWNKAFNLYREDGSTREFYLKKIGDDDYDKNDYMINVSEKFDITEGEMLLYNKTIGMMAGVGFPSYIEEAKWFDKKTSPLNWRRPDGTKDYVHFDSDKGKNDYWLETMSLISTFPVQLFMDHAMPEKDMHKYVKKEDITAWQDRNMTGETRKGFTNKLNENLDLVLREKDVMGARLLARVDGGPGVLEKFMECTVPGKLMYLIGASGNLNPDMEKVVRADYIGTPLEKYM